MPEQPDLQMIVYAPLAEADTKAKLNALIIEDSQYNKMGS